MSQLGYFIAAPKHRRRVMPLVLAAISASASYLPVRHLAIGLLLLIQFGLVLLWQPLYQIDGHVGRRGSLFAFVICVVLVIMGPFLLPLWVAMLAALVACRMSVWQGVWSRRFHLILLLWLLLLLWLRALPGLVGTHPGDQSVLAGILIASWLGLCVLPMEPEVSEARYPIDLIFGLCVLLIAVLVGLGAMLLDALHTVNYVAALALVLVVVGGALGALAWLWNPHGGFAGLGAMISAQLLQLDSPFERWSGRLALLYEECDRPRDFLSAACAALLALPPIVGGRWACNGDEGEFGQKAAHGASFAAGDVTLHLYAEGLIPHALHRQFQLVVELLRQFYLAKQGERRLADYMYIEAVHETGARLTHDIKNLLQSLSMLVGAAKVSAEPERLLALYQGQLPEIVRRLEGTLAQLREPVDDGGLAVDVDTWWHGARARWSGRGVEFLTPEGAAGQIDAVLFDAVLDNLIKNALDKSLAATSAAPVKIMVCLDRQRERWRLAVEDSGAAVPPDAVPELFHHPLASTSGYGLGLYHCSKMAARRAFTLKLERNDAGCVRFVLEGPW